MILSLLSSGTKRRATQKTAGFKTQGILAPLLVRELEESKYEVVAGASPESGETGRTRKTSRHFGFLANRFRASRLAMARQLLASGGSTEQEVRTRDLHSERSSLWHCPPVARP